MASRLRKARELLHEQISALAASPELLEATMTGFDDWARDLREQFGGDPPPNGA